MRKWIVWILLCGTLCPVLAQQTIIRVVDDHGEGIRSELFQIDNHGQRQPLGPTDEKGYAAIAAPCIRGCILKAVPSDRRYYFGKQYCPVDSGAVIKVFSASTYKILKGNADRSARDSNFATAALLFNEVYARGKLQLSDSSVIDSQEVAMAEQQTYEMFAKYLGVEEPTRYDPLQDKKVISTEFKDSIKGFQASINEKPTGTIDVKTLQKAAKGSVAKYLFKTIK